MKPLHQFCIQLLLMSFTGEFLSAASAQTAVTATPADTQTVDTAVLPPVVQGTTVATDKPAEVKKRKKPEEKKEEFQTSKLTSNKSTGLADHVVKYLTLGVDDIVDLDPSIQVGDKQNFILEGNASVVKPVLLPAQRQIILKPVGVGETNITVRDKSSKVVIVFDVFVSASNLQRIRDDLKDILKEVEGINIHLEALKVVIDGEVLTPNDYVRIINVISDKVYAYAVVNRVVMSAVTLNALAKKIEQDLQVISPTVRSSVLNGKIILEGTVESEALRTRALRRAEWYLPVAKVSEPINKDPNIEKNEKPLQIIQSDIQVNVPPPKRESKLIRLSVYFVELSKDFLKTFGFKWQPGFTADPSIALGTSATGTATTGTGSGGFTFSGTLSSLFPAFNAPPSSASYGRILKSATVVVKSEDKALIRDEEEIPTQTLATNGSITAGPKDSVGFFAEFTPKIMQGQDVDISISLEQKAVVGHVGTQSTISKQHVDSRVYLKSGEVAAVAGVNGQDLTTSFNRDDPNSTAPAAGSATHPLFTLQRSKNQAKKRGQFVVFVSPQIIESASEGTEDLKKNFRIPSSH